MSRYVGPKCRLCRREGEKLFLKGERCLGEKCALTRKQQPPGVVGRSRRRPTEYSFQLREKQKAKRMYGLLEAPFRRLFQEARKQTESTGTALLSFLERRLDNAIYRLGLASSRAQARQRVLGKTFAVNGRMVTSPSYRVRAGDKITLLKETIARSEKDLPGWLSWDGKKREGLVTGTPDTQELETTLDTSLIVEFYSR